MYGFSKEWRGVNLGDVETRKLRLSKLNQRKEVFDDSDEANPQGFLHRQWIRRDLLGMPMRWDDELTLVVPASAFERVTEDFYDFKIAFQEIV